MRRWRRPLVIIAFGMFVGTCIGWAAGPATRYRTTAIFQADPRGRSGHGTQAERDAFLREWCEIETAAFSTLRFPDLPEIAVQHRGKCSASSIQTGAQLHEHLEISFLADTRLIQAKVEDLSQLGADQTLEAFVAAATARISQAGPRELVPLNYLGRLHNRDHRREWFAAFGAAIGTIATCCILLLKSRARSTAATPSPPLQPALSP